MSMKKKLNFKERFTFLVIRNADQSVKQFQISKLLLLAVPLTAMIAAALLIFSIGWLSSYKEELTNQVEQLEYILEDKDGDLLSKEISIQNLQNEIIELSSQTADMQTRLERIADLEQELQELISSFNGKNKTASVQTLDEDTFHFEMLDDASSMGGEYLPFDETQALQLAEDTKLALEQMSNDLVVLDTNIAKIMQEAKELQIQLDRTPSFWPTKSTRITSKFGYRKDPITRKTAFHAGIDFGANYGDPIYAAGTGKVVEVGRNNIEGRYIVINHGYGLKSKYMHLSSTSVKKDQEVTRGDIIGKAGSTGRSTGVHLHFEIFKNGVQVDPLPYITSSR